MKWVRGLFDSSGIKASVSEIGILSRIMVEGSMNAAEKSCEQRKRVREVVQSEGQIATSANDIWANSIAVSRQADAAGIELEAGKRTIDAASKNMIQMMETVTTGTDLMQEFVARMAEVNLIVGDISGIARQTNLLALNAAIEAAHAGKHGEGFSIIAQEIRTLADRAAASTTMIAEQISKMDSSAMAAAHAMQAGKNAASQSLDENVGVQRSIIKIRAAMDEVRSRSAEVAQASEKQLAEAKGAYDSVMQVDRLAAESSVDADAAAEMSIKMVLSTTQVHVTLHKWNPMQRAAMNRGRRATDHLIKQIEEQQTGLLEALASLRTLCSEAGPPAIEGEMMMDDRALPGLRFGQTLATQCAGWLAKVRQRTGFTSSIFVLDGDRFIRVITNVKPLKNEDMAGSVLNPRGVVISELRRGRTYSGAVYLLGKPFVAAYEPIWAADGSVIGALCVGRSLQWKGYAVRAYEAA